MTPSDALRDARREEHRAGQAHLRAVNRLIDGGADDTEDTLRALRMAVRLRLAAEERVAANRMGVDEPMLVALEGGR